MTEQNPYAPQGDPQQPAHPYGGSDAPPAGAAVPPQAPPPGGQLPPGAPMQPGGPSAPPPPPPAPPKKKSKIISIIVTVIALAIGGFYLWNQVREDQLLQEGNCVVMSGEANDPKIDEAKCDDQTKASYKVVKVIKASDAKCEGDYSTYEVTKRGKTIAAYCLMENLFANKCYAVSGKNPSDFKMVECTDPKAEIKVAKVVESTDQTQCDAGSEAHTFPLGSRTYCLVPPS